MGCRARLVGLAYAPGYDANGNVILWVDLDDGSLAGEAEYGVLAEVLASSEFNGVLSFVFSSKYKDVGRGFLYYGYQA